MLQSSFCSDLANFAHASMAMTQAVAAWALHMRRALVAKSSLAAPSAMVSAANLKLRLNANDAASLVTDTSGASHNGVNGVSGNNLVTFEAATTDTWTSPILRRGAMKFDQAVDPRATSSSNRYTLLTS